MKISQSQVNQAKKITKNLYQSPIFKMARLSCIILVAAAVAVAAVNSQFVGYGPYGYATTATSFSLPFVGGFQYAPVVKAVAPFAPYAAPFFPYGAPYAPAVVKTAVPAYPYGYGAPVLKAPLPFAAPIAKAVIPGFAGPVVKTAVPAFPAPVLKAGFPFAGPIGAPVVKAGFPFAGPVVGPVAGPVGPVPAPVPAPVAF